MPFDVKCDMCCKSLNIGGGLLFGAPLFEGVPVSKRHLCVACLPQVIEFIASKRPADAPPTLLDLLAKRKK